MDYLEFKNVGSQVACKVEVMGWKLMDEVGWCFLWPSVLMLGPRGLVTWVMGVTFLGSLSTQGGWLGHLDGMTGTLPGLVSMAMGGEERLCYEELKHAPASILCFQETREMVLESVCVWGRGARTVAGHLVSPLPSPIIPQMGESRARSAANSTYHEPDHEFCCHLGLGTWLPLYPCEVTGYLGTQIHCPACSWYQPEDKHLAFFGTRAALRSLG